MDIISNLTSHGLIYIVLLRSTVLSIMIYNHSHNMYAYIETLVKRTFNGGSTILTRLFSLTAIHCPKSVTRWAIYLVNNLNHYARISSNHRVNELLTL